MIKKSKIISVFLATLLACGFVTAETAMNGDYRFSGKIRTGSGTGSYNPGNYATSLGYDCVSGGHYACTIGAIVTASGYASFAQGLNSNALYDRSVVMGQGLNSSWMNAFVIGRFNANPTASNAAWAPGDPLFVIGNGDSDTVRGNALVVFKSGAAALKGTLEVGTLNTPNSAVVRVPQSGDISMGAFN